MDEEIWSALNIWPASLFTCEYHTFEMKENRSSKDAQLTSNQPKEQMYAAYSVSNSCAYLNPDNTAWCFCRHRHATWRADYLPQIIIKNTRKNLN